MEHLYILQRPATGAAVPIGRDRSRPGRALLPGDLFDVPPPGLESLCLRLEAGASDTASVAAAAAALRGFGQVAAAVHLLESIVSPPPIVLGGGSGGSTGDAGDRDETDADRDDTDADIDVEELPEIDVEDVERRGRRRK